MNPMIRKISGGTLAISAALLVGACLMPVGDGEGLTRTGDPIPPDTNFQFVLDEVFRAQNAGCLGCHGSFPTGDPLRLNNPTNALATLFDNGANRLTTAAQDQAPRWRVYRTSDTTGVADSSYLYVKLASDAPKNGTRMPQGGNPLTADQITIVRRWIEKGAKF